MYLPGGILPSRRCRPDNTGDHGGIYTFSTRAGLGENMMIEVIKAMGVPPKRALAAVTARKWILRETSLPGAVLTLVGTSQGQPCRGDMSIQI